MSNDQQPVKKKRIHLDAAQCIQYGKSYAGLQPLKSPVPLRQMMLLGSPRKQPRLSGAAMVTSGQDRGVEKRLNSPNLAFGTRLRGTTSFITASQMFKSEVESSFHASDFDFSRSPRLRQVQDFTNFKGVAEEHLNQESVGNVLNFRQRALQFRNLFHRDSGEGQPLTSYSGSPSHPIETMDDASASSSSSTKKPGVRKRKPKPQSNTLFNYYNVKGNASTQTNVSPIIGNCSGEDSTDSIPKPQVESHKTVASQLASHPPHVRKLFLDSDDNDEQFDAFLDRFDAFMAKSCQESNVESDNSQSSRDSVVLLSDLSQPTREVNLVSLSSDSSQGTGTRTNELGSQEIWPTSSFETPQDLDLQELAYGLFGSTGNDSPFTDEENESSEVVNFAILPTYIFEMILCRLPLADLLLHYARVSKVWNEVICNENFIPWKKKYYRLKTGVEATVSEIQSISTTAGMNRIETCLLGLIRFMSGFNIAPPRDAIVCLQKHTKYHGAEELIRDNAPECLQNLCWPMVAALVILSETFWDVYNVLKYLVSGSCPVVDALEALYCIASFLLHFKRQYKTAYGLHYRIYYALYIFENQWVAKVEDLTAVRGNLSGQQNIMKYGSGHSKLRLTNEQMRIVNHKLQANHLVKIVAFAGSGKTSTLVEYTTLHLGMNFLMVVYNKAVAEHAKKCFPANVECRTSHSLAWGGFGAIFRSNLTQKIRPYDIMSYLKSAPSNYAQKQKHARCVIVTVENFMASADGFITTAHVPTEVRSQDEMNSLTLSDRERLNIADDAKTIWRKMADPKDYQVRAVHDCYLKLYQLSKPVLVYDCILIDEAQDCNPAILDVLLNQACPKIVVGDPNQQIYAFRGAVDALDRVQATHVFYLTQSFRFGPEIAYVSSLALEVLKGKDRKTLVGGTQKSCVSGSNEGQVAILARSNVALFNEAVRMVCKNGPSRSYDPEQVSGAFAGGIAGYGLDQLVDIYDLLEQTRQHIKDKFISRFKSFSALQQYAKNVDDGELLGKIQLVKQYAYKIPEYVGTIKARCGTPLPMANVVFSTVHKAKGLEFDTVCVMDDFNIGQFPYNRNPSTDLRSEYNILYVAITRAKKCLCMPTTVYFMLLGAQERLEYPISIVGEGAAILKCTACLTDFGPSGSHVFVRRRLDLNGCRAIPEGPLCDDCSNKDVFIPEIRHPNQGIFFGHPSLEDKYHQMFKWIVARNT